MIRVSDAEFERDVLRSHKPVLVHFTGSGEVSRSLAPVLDRLASRLGTRSRVARIELDPNAALAARFGVFAPSLVYFREGSVAGRRSDDAADDADLFDWLDGMGIGCACHPD